MDHPSLLGEQFRLPTSWPEARERLGVLLSQKLSEWKEGNRTISEYLTLDLAPTKGSRPLNKEEGEDFCCDLDEDGGQDEEEENE